LTFYKLYHCIIVPALADYNKFHKQNDKAKYLHYNISSMKMEHLPKIMHSK